MERNGEPLQEKLTLLATQLKCPARPSLSNLEPRVAGTYKVIGRGKVSEHSSFVPFKQ